MLRSQYVILKRRTLKSIRLPPDILVVAVGIKEFITGDMIKDGAIVIDVGMNRVDGKLYGDVNSVRRVKSLVYYSCARRSRTYDDHNAAKKYGEGGLSWKEISFLFRS